MPSSKEFIDCPHCRKRVLASASSCHRCRQPLTQNSRGRQAQQPSVRPYSPNDEDDQDDEDSEAHMASDAGYTDEYNDEDYREFVETELNPKPFRTRARRWVWLVAMFLLLWFLYVTLGWIADLF